MPWDCVDWLLGPEIRSMPAAAQAGYFNLLCYSWIEDGLKLDRDEIEMVSSLSKKEWRRYGDRILSHFYIAEDGRLRNTRQEQERAIAINKIAHDRKRTEAATKARWPVRNASVTENISRLTGQDRTGQDKTVPPPNPATQGNTDLSCVKKEEVSRLLQQVVSKSPHLRDRKTG